MQLEITVDGRPVLTARMAVDRYAQLYNLSDRGVRSAVARSGVPPVDPPPIHSRIPVYDRAALDEAFRPRSGASAASPPNRPAVPTPGAS